MIARYDLGDRVIRTGFVTPEEVSAHLLACEAIVLPYRDGVSFRRGTFMAALAHGCPVITTQPAFPLPDPSAGSGQAPSAGSGQAPSAGSGQAPSTGSGQGLRDGDNVRLVPPEDVPAIVLAVSQLLDAPDLRARLGRGARALSALFTWDRIAARTLEFLRVV